MDYRTFRAKYLSIAEALRERILSGQYAPGTRLPSEIALAHQFNVSRGTVERAIRTLVQEGLLYRQQGRGTFVSKPDHKVLPFRLDIRRWQEQVDSGSIRLVHKGLILPPPDIAQRLQVGFNQKVIDIVRIHLEDGKPVAHEVRYLPESLCPELLNEDLEHQSVHQLLVEKYKIPLLKAVYTIQAIAMGEDEARLLQTGVGTQGFLVERLTFTTGQRPAVFFRQVSIGNRYAFRAEIVTESRQQAFLQGE